jgi:hypothetical protein
MGTDNNYTYLYGVCNNFYGNGFKPGGDANIYVYVRQLYCVMNLCAYVNWRVWTKIKQKNTFYVINFRAYDQYMKTEPSYAQYYCLFIYVFCSSSPRHVSASKCAISGGYIKLHKMCMTCEYKILNLLKC